MVGHVESVEPRLGVVDEDLGGRLSVKFVAVSLHVGNLPQAGDDTT